jgi:hypothetical protein
MINNSSTEIENLEHCSMFFSNLKDFKENKIHDPTDKDIPVLILQDLLSLDNVRLQEMDLSDEHDRKYVIKNLIWKKIELKQNIQTHILNNLFPTIYSEIFFLYPILFHKLYIPISYIYLALDNMYSRKFMKHVDFVLKTEYDMKISTRFSKILYYYLPILFKYRYPSIVNTILQNAIKNDSVFDMKIYDVLLRFNFSPETDKLSLHNIEKTIDLDNKEYCDFINANYLKFRYYHYKANSSKYLNVNLRVNEGFNNGFCYHRPLHKDFVSMLTNCSKYSHFITYLDSKSNTYIAMNYNELYDYFNRNGFVNCFKNSGKLETYTFDKLLKLESVKSLLSIVNFMASKLTQEEQKYSSLLSVLISEHIPKMEYPMRYYYYLLSVNFKSEYDMFCDYIQVLLELLDNKIDPTNWIIAFINDGIYENQEYKTNILSNPENECLLIECVKSLKKMKIYNNFCNLPIDLNNINLTLDYYISNLSNSYVKLIIIEFLSQLNPKIKNKSQTIIN